jgi:hypothetical protein
VNRGEVLRQRLDPVQGGAVSRAVWTVIEDCAQHKIGETV